MPAIPSPIVINTSPLAIPFQTPSVTPPSSHRRGSDILGKCQQQTTEKSSSPSLRSPSSFLRSRPSGLKSGSCVQQLPTDVNTGFSTVTTLLKPHHFPAQDEIPQDKDTVATEARKRKARSGKKADKESVEESISCPKHSPGKLVRPRKKRKTERISDQANKTHDEPAEEKSVFFCAAETRDAPTFTASKTTSPPRTLNFGPIQYEFQEEDPGSNRVKAIEPVVKRARKPSKRKAKEKDAQDAPADKAPTKRARKRITKSASVILNSDEPDHESATAWPTAEKLPQQVDGSAARSDLVNVEIAEKSSYFDGPSKSKPPHQPEPPLEGTVDVVDVAKAAALPQDMPFEQTSVVTRTAPAPKRRLSWTPVKDTSPSSIKGVTALPPNVMPDESEPKGIEQSQDEGEMPKQNLGNLLGSFIHIPCGSSNGKTKPPTSDLEIANIAPVIKKRMWKSGTKVGKSVVEGVSDFGTTKPVGTKAKRNREAKPKMPKDEVRNENALKGKVPKEKKEKKKGQTITALATAGFVRPEHFPQGDGHSEEQRTHGNGTITQPLSRPSNATTVDEYDRGAAGVRMKDLLAAKDASPNANEVGPAAALPTKLSKAKAKPKKASKSQAKQPAPVHPGRGLHDPAIAREDMATQSFLFGTSSQLRLEESPDFIRDLQSAVEESVATARSPEKSVAGETADYDPLSTFQPTAQPYIHGSSPSKVRTRGSAIRVPSAPHGTNLSVQQGDRELWSVSARDHRGEFLIGSLTRPGLAANTSHAPSEHDRHLLAVHTEDLVHSAVVLHNCDSPGGGEPTVILGEIEIADHDIGAQIGSLREATTPDNNTTEAKNDVALEDDSWMLLRSDESIAVPLQSQTDPGDQDSQRKDYASALEPVQHLKATAPRSDASPIRLHAPVRSPLRPLDHNIPLPLLMGADKSVNATVRTFTSSTVDHAKARERKSSPGKGRPGQPRKNLDIAQTSPTPAPQTSVPALTKKRGRPPKTKPPDPTLDVVQSSPSSSRWLDVDEISDSDSPVSPSPPRRRKRAVDNAPLPTLQLSPSASQVRSEVHHEEELTKVVEEVTASSSGYPLRTGDPQWSSLRADLFKTITNTIKNSKAPASSDGDGETTSWYQKILLYDPIVVEDLTYWLNAQGLRVDVRKCKPKPKAKGKKAREEAGSVTEVEVVREPLQSWMVQKWCQENSVCCYAQDGSWRGGRNKNY